MSDKPQIPSPMPEPVPVDIRKYMQNNKTVEQLSLDALLRIEKQISMLFSVLTPAKTVDPIRPDSFVTTPAAKGPHPIPQSKRNK